jgi:hypothetical protein
VILGDKSRWGCDRLRQGATGKLVDPIAKPASEVVMMLLGGPFIKGAHFGRVNFPEPPLLHQELEIAIHGCLIQGIYHATARIEHLLDCKRPVLFLKDLLYRLSLTRSSPYRYSPGRTRPPLLKHSGIWVHRAVEDPPEGPCAFMQGDRKRFFAQTHRIPPIDQPDSSNRLPCACPIGRTAEGIMAKVAENQDRGESLCTAIFYDQELRLRFLRSDGKVAREPRGPAT